MTTKTKKASKKHHPDKFGMVARHVAAASGQPATFLIAFGIIIVWAVTGPIFKFNDTWQLVINTSTTIVTFLMVFLIQNTQNRDAEAVQIKLDEIIRAIGDAENGLMSLEDKSQEELDEIKKQYMELAKIADAEIKERKKAS